MFLKTLLGKNSQSHPKGLYFLLATEAWEKFSYFGTRFILVYYMVKHLAFEQAYASSIYGWFTGLVYLTTIGGGILGDRVLGRQKSVILGMLLMMIGHFVMTQDFLFYPALVLLIVGSGVFGPNISPQVAALYDKKDPRGAHAFSLVYLGVNIGATLAPFVCGTLGEIYGWHYGFGAAGIGMLLGLIVYLIGRKHLPSDYAARERFVHHTITNHEVAAEDKADKSQQRIKMIGFSILIIFGILFRIVYNQQGNTLALWIDSHVDRFIGSWEMPATWFQSINPFAVIIFTPFLVRFWNWQAARNQEPSSINKMAIGCFVMGAFFLLLAPAAISTRVNIIWPALAMLILTVGELYFCPIALAFITRNAPKGTTALAVSIWYQSYFLGNLLSGQLGKLFNVLPKAVFFLVLSGVVFIAGFGISRLARFLKKRAII